MHVHLKTKLLKFKQSLRQQQIEICLSEAQTNYLNHKNEFAINSASSGVSGKKSKNTKSKKGQLSALEKDQLDEDISAIKRAEGLVREVSMMDQMDEALAREEQCILQLHMSMARGILQVYTHTLFRSISYMIIFHHKRSHI